MTKLNVFWRIVFIAVLIFSAYHLLRDFAQIIHINSAFTDFLHWKHDWCGQYCNFITLPFDLFGVVGSAIVLWRGKAGVIGILVLAMLPIWLTAVLLP